MKEEVKSVSQQTLKMEVRKSKARIHIELEEDCYGVACFHYYNNIWRFSLRSDKLDCSEIAKQFGGGGHKGAAGFILESTEALKEFLCYNKTK